MDGAAKVHADGDRREAALRSGLGEGCSFLSVAEVTQEFYHISGALGLRHETLEIRGVNLQKCSLYGFKR